MRAAIALVLLLTACKGSDTHSPIVTPGAPTSAATTALDQGANVLQARVPIAE